MKKVPILSEIENGFDKTIKELMGPLKAFYPALKLATIYSNPASAVAYTAYRSIPYLVDGLTSAKAINIYKSVGKVVGKGALSLGLSTAKILGKYSSKAIMSLSKITKQQFENVTDYFMNKNFSIESIKDSIKDFKYNENNFYNTFENNFNNKYEIEQEDVSFIDKRILRQADAAAFLLDISKNEYINNIKEKILNGEMEYNSEAGIYYYKRIENKIEDNNINREENIREAIEVKEPEKNIIKIGGRDEVIFNKINGKITRQYRLCGNLGKETEITEEQYNSYIKDVERNRQVSKEKNKERDVEFSL